MAINPKNPNARLQFARALEHSRTELDRFALMRANTVHAYLGISSITPESAVWNTSFGQKKYVNSLPKGNLIQQAALSQQIALAYGEPQFMTANRTPDQAGLSDKLGPALNRLAMLLNLGETARNVAADSFFGYGIFKVGVGYMPLSAQAATGLRVGPCAWRVSQEQFVYDVFANSWDNVSYVGDDYLMPLSDAQEIFSTAADRLASMIDMDRLDQQHVLARPTRAYMPEEMVRLIDIYFPALKIVATWAVRNHNLRSVSDEPIAIRDYDGHWSGVYQVLSHLYSPDELVPVAQAESVKALHFLFNDLLDITSNQAREAKVNPMYQKGAEKDMIQLWQAADRKPVGVNNPTQFGSWEVPGPTQSQTAYMSALMQLFDKFVPTSDQPQTSATATQAGLTRQTTNATVAEARRKFNRVLQLVGYKLGHLLLNNNELTLPSSRPLHSASKIQVDTTWRPAHQDPRNGIIDDFDIAIDPFPLIYRSAEEKQQQLMQSIQVVTQVGQARAMGTPISVERTIDLLASFGQPELKTLFEEADPAWQARAQQSRGSAPRVGVGQYTRTNVSEKTNEGQLTQNLTQVAEQAEATGYGRTEGRDLATFD